MTGKISRRDFYAENVRNRITFKDASILVVGGGILDKEVFEAEGFTNVTISNLDTRMNSEQYLPYEWQHLSMQEIRLADNSFDYVVTHAALHHCRVPHKGLTEMYRVARKGILCFESRDSLTLRTMIRLGITSEYEQAAVYYNDCKYGGVENSEIPNYVYRWTEREIEKCINTFAPEYKHLFEYKYGLAEPANLRQSINSRKRLLKIVLTPAYKVFFAIFPKERNLFCFYVEKTTSTDKLHPWLTFEEKEQVVGFNKSWASKRFD